jgi:benzoate 4-monooxygenase
MNCTKNMVRLQSKIRPLNYIMLNFSSLGTFVRLAPNHVSIADPNALQFVYAHGNGSLKSNFYDAFVSIHRGLFNTRSRSEHSRKRKIVSNIFSMKNVLEFEPYIRGHIREFLIQWDKLCEGGAKGLSGSEGEGGWYGRDGRVWFDCLPCTFAFPD